MKTIKSVINQTYPISEQALNKLTTCMQKTDMPKRSILIEPGIRNNNIYFVEKGIARAYLIIEGKEVTSWFSQEGDLLYSTNSFHGKVAGYESEMVQILEDSTLYYIPIPVLEDLCMNDVEISNWMRMIHQRAFVEMERRLIFRLYMSAEERYKDLLSRSPELLQRVNLGYIASFLGMSHVTLCSLRK